MILQWADWSFEYPCSVSSNLKGKIKNRRRPNRVVLYPSDIDALLNMEKEDMYHILLRIRNALARFD